MDKVENSVLENAEYLVQQLALSSDLQLFDQLTGRQQSGIVVFLHKTIDNNILFKHLRSNGVVCALRGGGIRFSPNFYTTHAQLDRAVQIAVECEGQEI